MYAGRGRRDRPGRRPDSQSRDALHRRTSRLGAAPGRPAGRASGADPRRASFDGGAAARLPVRAALPAGDRRLPHRRTAAALRGPRPRGGVHPHRRRRRPLRRRRVRRLDRAPRTRSRSRRAGGPARREPRQDLQADQGRGVPAADRRGAGRRRHQLRTPRKATRWASSANPARASRRRCTRSWT